MSQSSTSCSLSVVIVIYETFERGALHYNHEIYLDEVQNQIDIAMR